MARVSLTHDDRSPEQPQARPVRRTLAGVRVLVAEDQEMVRDLISLLLNRERVEVTAVHDGAVALELAHGQAFDVILMDMNMPVMSGFEATRRIRQSGGASGNAVILALTANVSKAEIAQCLRAGMDGHIAKPFNTNTLNAAILNALDGAR